MRGSSSVRRMVACTASAALLLIMLALVAPSPPAAAAVPYQQITSTGPLSSVAIGNELSCQVRHVADADLQLYPPAAVPGDCGTFVAVGADIYAPDFANHDGTATSGIGTFTPFTPVSQTSLTGSGTEADPFRIVTVADVGTTGLRITETDTYVTGEELYRTDVEVANNGASPVSFILYRAGDCYLAGSDVGFGFLDLTRRAVGCSVNANNSPVGRIEQWRPLTGGNNFYEAHFNEVWQWIGTKQPFPDTCDCEEGQDNGAGLSWNITLAAGARETRSHQTVFSPTGQVPASCPGPTWYLAEGTTRDAFDEFLLVLNAGLEEANVKVLYTIEGAPSQTRNHKVQALSRLTIPVFDPANLGRGIDHGAVVSSDQPILVERSMYVNGFVAGLLVNGDHNAMGEPVPRPIWYFAEGTTLQSFRTYFTVANPTSTDAVVEVTYGKESGGVVVVSKPVPALARITIDASSTSDGVGSGVVGFSTAISATVPILAERPVYFDHDFAFRPGVVERVNGATGAFGTAPSQVWHLAEGTVLPNFNEYLALGNPGAEATTATITYGLEGSTPIEKVVSVGAESRLTVPVFDSGSPGGIGRDVSDPTSRGVSVTVRTGAPGGVTLERAMYFAQVFDPALPRVIDGHAAGGSPELKRTWYFAEGTGLPTFRTFLTVLNPDVSDAQVTVTYLPDDNSGAVDKTIVVPAGQRRTIKTFDASDPAGYGAGKTGYAMKVVGNRPILVERPEYEDHDFGAPIGVVNGGNVSVGLPSPCVGQGDALA